MVGIIEENVLTWAKENKEARFHALLCDPPYELAFMGKSWDGSGISFQSETWATLGGPMLPGALGMAFSSARTHHRMAVAIEDAGFILHPTIFLWCYSSGFPKASRIDTVVDNRAGVERKVVGRASRFGRSNNLEDGKFIYGDYVRHYNLTAATTPMAQAWEDHRYGRQAIMPSAEPIIVFQKPHGGSTQLDGILKHGTGAYDIRGASFGERVIKSVGGAMNKSQSLHTHWSGEIDHTERIGLWPKNLVLVHDPECEKDRCTQDCPVSRIEAQHAGDSNYYLLADWMYDKVEDVCLSVPKPSQAERDAGLDEMPLTYKRNALTTHNGTGDFRGVDGKPLAVVRNDHTTVKPIRLAKWLATLLLPPAEYGPRRLFNPFGGSGSEAIGAMLSGWEEIVAVEMEPHYVDMARRRVGWWERTGMQLGTTKIERILSFASLLQERKVESFNDLPLFSGLVKG